MLQQPGRGQLLLLLRARKNRAGSEVELPWTPTSSPRDASITHGGLTGYKSTPWPHLNSDFSHCIEDKGKKRRRRSSSSSRKRRKEALVYSLGKIHAPYVTELNLKFVRNRKVTHSNPNTLCSLGLFQ